MSRRGGFVSDPSTRVPNLSISAHIESPEYSNHDIQCGQNPGFRLQFCPDNNRLIMLN